MHLLIKQADRQILQNRKFLIQPTRIRQQRDMHTAMLTLIHARGKSKPSHQNVGCITAHTSGNAMNRMSFLGGTGRLASPSE